MKILVTGASGFVGGHLVCGLASQGHEVCSLFLNSELPTEVRRASSRCVQADLRDLASCQLLLEQLQPEVVIHSAALAKSADCEKEPALARAINVTATENLVTALQQQSDLARLIYLSTDLVFDGGIAPSSGFSELDTATPASIYARTKFDAEQVVLRYQGPAGVLRICLVYGPKIGNLQGFLGWTLEALATGKALKLFTDEWRTPVLVNDIVDVIGKLSSTKPEELPRLMHLPGSDRISRYDFGLELCSLLKLDSNLLRPALQADVSLSSPRSPDVSLSGNLVQTFLGRRTYGVAEGLRVALKV